jgi:hypothetical protein
MAPIAALPVRRPLAHDFQVAREFLRCLDSTATKFTFQTFRDAPTSSAIPEVLHGTLQEVWPKLSMLNSLPDNPAVRAQAVQLGRPLPGEAVVLEAALSEARKMRQTSHFGSQLRLWSMSQATSMCVVKPWTASLRRTLILINPVKDWSSCASRGGKSYPQG